MVTRVQRLWVYALLVLLVVPGVIGFDAWPLTGWRLFSLSRDGSQVEWALDVRVDGSTTFREVDLEELPLAFRNAAWPLAELAGASDARRQAVCAALLDGVLDTYDDAVELALVRERRTLTDDGVDEEREVVAQCRA
jgi:hypothetical protein